MAIRGSLTIECDRPTCHAEVVLEAEDATVDDTRRGLKLDLLKADGWHLDDDGTIWCPQCCTPEERERNADGGSTYGHPGDALADRE